MSDKQKENLSERAYRLLEEKIVNLSLAPGSAVSEVQLSTDLKIGRTPVREAIRQLANEGMVVIRPRKSMFISDVAPLEHILVLETRAPLERQMAASAARRANTPERQELLDCADEMVACAKARTVDAFLNADKRFDLVLGAACRNPFTARACAPLQSMSRRFWYAYQGVQNIDQAADLHHAIASEVSAGDPDRSAACVDDLVAYLAKAAREIIDSFM